MIKRVLLFVLMRISSEYKRPEWCRRLLGVKIGRGNRFTGIINFGSEPYLIELGDNVTLAQGTTFITHDGAVGLFRKECKGLNVFGRITIADNVFVGSSVIILPGVSVGSNVVIGAGSVVTKSIPAETVVAGVPAKMVKSLAEYKADAIKKGVMLEEGVSRKAQVLQHCAGSASKGSE